MFKTTIYTVLILSVILISACSKNRTDSLDAKPASEINPDAVPAQVKSGSEPIAGLNEISNQNNEFCFKLLHEIDEHGKNLFFSPFSINTAMGMVYTGAEGQTAKQIATAMDYHEAPSELHEKMGAYQKELNILSDKQAMDLSIANSLFASDKNADRLVERYLKILESSFDSEIHTLDFGQSEESAAFINEWVGNATADRIQDLVTKEQIRQTNDGMILVNAIYFKADWLHKFDPKSTSTDRFFLSSDRDTKKSKEIQLMHIKDRFGYAKVGSFEILEMPYKAEDLSMIFILPEDIDTIGKELSETTWQELTKALKIQETRVYIPRFRLEESLDLVPAMQSMGIRDAFDPYHADFSGIMNLDKRSNLYISSISHKAFLEVQEEGSEAAAATEVSFAITSIAPPTVIPIFRADKPFLCMIVHKADNKILFLGKVVDPEAVE